VLEHLEKIDPARPLTLEEARPKIVEALKKQNLQQVTKMKAALVAQQLRDELKKGKSLADVAAQGDVKLEKIPPFALVDTPPGATPAPKPEAKEEAPDMRYIKQNASGLSPGEVSEYIGTPDGGLLVALEKREKLDDAQFEKARTFLEERELTNQGQIVFYEWLRERRRAAGVAEAKPATKPG
jgi:hypothetical protein